MSLDIKKIAAIISIGEGLVLTGLEIINIVNNKDGLDDEAFKAIIEKQNKAQLEKEAKLLALLEDPVDNS